MQSDRFSWKMKKRRTELVFIPGPGIGHVKSSVELAKLLINREELLSITFLIINLPFDTAANNYIHSLTTNPTPRIQFLDLPSPSEINRSKPSTLAFELINAQKPHVREAVAHMKDRAESSSPRLVGLVIDMFCINMVDVGNEFGLPSYLFFTSSVGFMGLMFHLQTLNDNFNKDVTEYKDSDAELSVQTFTNPVPSKVLPSAAMEKAGGRSEIVLSIARRFRETKGIMVNTFLELESHAVNSLSNEENPPIYPVGPILKFEPFKASTDVSVMSWLDDQPPGSVVFLCFGSLGSFAGDQVKEIANALEDSGHRFLWSLRRPPPEGSLEIPGEYANPEEVLPEGFLERTEGVGKVIGWAPQVGVLSHRAVGGFVSHCGWNSILESLWFGVPIATWPIYAEQQMNAFELVTELGMAVEIRMDYRNDGDDIPFLVRAKEIETGIRKLMAMDSRGAEIRSRVKDMGDISRMALREGGSSYTWLGRFLENII